MKRHVVALQGQSSMLSIHEDRSSSEGEWKFDMAFWKVWEIELVTEQWPCSPPELFPILLKQVNVQSCGKWGLIDLVFPVWKRSIKNLEMRATAVSGVPAALLATVEGLLNWGLILLAQMLPEHSPGIPLGWWAQSVKWWKDDFVPVITVCKLLSSDCKGSNFLIMLVPRCLMVDVLLF